ncbi:hypothetical protein BpHYR1_016004 [Brachionus plicatilis]|uniref:Uncharacterized protein n=1 Tax=Brachionus plicatilis TaxID=10195 RepID=A0A3M7RAU2_BRAPC|nr:hypothetical protein BpHYR1_016004 [Brachionus plicatilis]
MKKFVLRRFFICGEHIKEKYLKYFLMVLFYSFEVNFTKSADDIYLQFRNYLGFNSSSFFGSTVISILALLLLCGLTVPPCPSGSSNTFLTTLFSTTKVNLFDLMPSPGKSFSIASALVNLAHGSEITLTLVGKLKFLAHAVVTNGSLTVTHTT